MPVFWAINLFLKGGGSRCHLGIHEMPASRTMYEGHYATGVAWQSLALVCCRESLDFHLDRDATNGPINRRKLGFAI